MPFYHRVYRELQLTATSAYRHTRLFLWVAQALLPVHSGHSQEWLCHISVWIGWAQFNV